MKKFVLALVVFSAVPVSWGATVAHWNFENPSGQPAGTVYDWGNGGWDLVIGPSGQIVPGKFGNGLKNIGGPGAAPGSVAKVETNRYNASQGLRGSALESVWTGAEWTMELFVRFDSSPTTEPAHIFQMGNSQLDFHNGLKDVHGLFWNVSDSRMHFIHQRIGTNNAADHNRPFEGMNDGQWHHVAQSLRAGRDYIFMDGLLIDSDPFGGDASDGFDATGQPFLSIMTTVQKVGTVVGESLVGTVDEIRISDAALYTQQFEIPTEPFPTPPPLVGTPTPTPTPSPTPTPAPVEVVAAWDFDVAPGSSIVPDITGNGFNLSLGTAGAITADGIVGGAITNTVGQVASVKDQVAVVDAIDDTLIDQAFAGPFTVEMWVRLNIPDDQRVNNHDDWATMFWCGSRTDRLDAFVMMHKGDHNGLTCFVPQPEGGTSDRLDGGTQQLVQGQWVHYAVQITEIGELQMFFNGERIGRFANVGFDPAGFASEGEPYLTLFSYAIDTSDQFIFPGSIDLLRISKGVQYKGTSFTPPLSFGPTSARTWTLLE